MAERFNARPDRGITLTLTIGTSAPTVAPSGRMPELVEAQPAPSGDDAQAA